MMLAAWGAKEWLAVIAPAVALFVAAITLLINGERAERQRRRELHARALAASIEYAEMPFAIRRRRCEDEHRSGERVRLTTQFSDIQAELSVCQALIDAEGNRQVSAACRELVNTTRAIAGAAAREAWTVPPIERDEEVSMPALAELLQPLEVQRARYTETMQREGRSTWRKFMDAVEAPDT
jgi:hypothetical protein